MNIELRSGNSDLTEAVQSAVEAIQRGDLGQGRATLTWVLRENPGDRLAWLWMACCVTDEPERDECYRRASKIPDRRPI
jgi:Tfp pilus assembly protein PilF